MRCDPQLGLQAVRQLGKNRAHHKSLHHLRSEHLHKTHTYSRDRRQGQYRATSKRTIGQSTTSSSTNTHKCPQRRLLVHTHTHKQTNKQTNTKCPDILRPRVPAWLIPAPRVLVSRGLTYRQPGFQYLVGWLIGGMPVGQSSCHLETYGGVKGLQFTTCKKWRPCPLNTVDSLLSSHHWGSPSNRGSHISRFGREISEDQI